MWNALPVPDQRLVFLISAKCGNTAVKRAVAERYGLPGNVHQHMPRWSPREVDESGYFKIAICRNPFARAVSCWWQKLAKPEPGRSGLHRHGFWLGMSFSEFCTVLDASLLRELHIRPQSQDMYHEGRYLPDVTYRLEDAGFWADIQRRFDLPDLVEANRSDAPDWRSLCLKEDGAVIARKYETDFEVFGYEMLRDRERTG